MLRASGGSVTNSSEPISPEPETSGSTCSRCTDARETCRQPSSTIERRVRRCTEIGWHQNAAEAPGGGAQGAVGGKDRAWRGPHDFLRHASYQYARNAAAPVRAHHYQGRIHRTGGPHDLPRRIRRLDRRDDDVRRTIVGGSVGFASRGGRPVRGRVNPPAHVAASSASRSRAAGAAMRRTSLPAAARTDRAASEGGLKSVGTSIRQRMSARSLKTIHSASEQTLYQPSARKRHVRRPMWRVTRIRLDAASEWNFSHRARFRTGEHVARPRVGPAFEADLRGAHRHGC